MGFRIILVSGRICSGKSSLGEQFKKIFGYKIIKSRELLLKYSTPEELPNERKALQRFGLEIDEKTNGRWVSDGLMEIIQANESCPGFFIDAVRAEKQIDVIRNKYGRSVVHVHLIAPDDILEERYEKRKSEGANVKECDTFRIASQDSLELQVDDLRGTADIVIDTAKTSKKDVYIPVAARLGLLSNPYERLVDVVVGGEYGSEGKGNICSYLAPEYEVLVRVGGPNAGHSVFWEGEKHVFHQLPSGTLSNPSAKLVIAPGSVINVQKVIEEIEKFKVQPCRLHIDANAMVISEKDITDETELVKSIGSTGQGVGKATARKIIGRSDSNTKLAKHIEELKAYICDTGEILEKYYCKGAPILIEGTQGTELSIHHGRYPYVTSRDTTVAGCLSEAGVSPSRVKNVIMVVRTYPIRVESPSESTSGPLEKEITWDEVSKRSKVPLEELQKTEVTSTTHRERRVGEFDWSLFRKACSLNAPTDIALTFVDYLDVSNQKARRFDQLTPDTIKFIEEIEIVARAPVSLVNTCFASRSIIDRRNWF